jgi:hypothetical protein
VLDGATVGFAIKVVPPAIVSEDCDTFKAGQAALFETNAVQAIEFNWQARLVLHHEHSGRVSEMHCPHDSEPPPWVQSYTVMVVGSVYA